MIFTIFSRLFDPIVILGVITIIGAWRSGMTVPTFEFFILVMFLGMVCLPLSILAWAIHTKRVSNWDVSDRGQRIYVLAAFIPFFLFDFLLIHYFGNLYVLRLFVVFALWFTGFFFITLFWKISGHSSSAALATAFFLRWFGLSWWPVLFVVPIISWLRVQQKKHTPAQTVVGALYSWVIFLLFISFGMV